MKTIFTIFCLFILNQSYAQQETSRIEQYCSVLVSSGWKTVSISIDYGEGANYLKDEVGKSFKSVIAALNYMGKNGWKLVNAFLVYRAKSDSRDLSDYIYVFKKEFSKNEPAE